MQFFLVKFEIFYEHHPLARHVKYKRTVSLLVTNQLRQISFVQPIWNDL